MKRSVFTLLLVLCVGLSTNALAQKTVQILIVSPGGIGSSATRLLNAVKRQYPGSVGLDVKIPADLSKYDALMILRPDGDIRAPWLDSLQQDQLIKYLQAGGAFYAEGVNFRNWTDSDD